MVVMFEIILAIIILCYVGLPIIFFILFWRSRYCSCPYCGDKILKTDKICTHCAKTMPKYDTLENKVIKVGHAWQESAKIMATPEGKRFTKLDEKK
jgi:hypothetical protein